MITKNVILNAFKKGVERTQGLQGSALLLESFSELRNIAEQLLDERDSALARAEAYREVAIDTRWRYSQDCGWINFTTEKNIQEIDAEAAELLSQRKGEGQ